MGLPAQVLTLTADERDERLQGNAYDPSRSQPSALYFAAILVIDLSEEGMATEGESGVARRGFETPVDEERIALGAGAGVRASGLESLSRGSPHRNGRSVDSRIAEGIALGRVVHRDPDRSRVNASRVKRPFRIERVLRLSVALSNRSRLFLPADAHRSRRIETEEL